jgi:hypothetical protein
MTDHGQSSHRSAGRIKGMNDRAFVSSTSGRGLRALRALMAATALTLAVVTNAVTAAPSDPFKGVWTSTDTDGSHQTLSFGGSGDTRAVHYFDAGASVCGWPAVNATATLIGQATVSGSSATADLAGQCNGTGQSLAATSTYTDDSGTNTLTDSFGVTWYR